MALTKVTTSCGIVEGALSANGSYGVFKKIPFAKPPVGALRFAPPVKAEPWEGVLSCTEFSAGPIQQAGRGEDPTKFQQSYSEDCLYLNIFTPAERADEKLPVMFWIFGGGFSAGNAANPSFEGESICAHGCILVTINYRVNTMGFFNTPEMEKRNGGCFNFGLMDQVMALDWVRENIGAFGGDVDRILIFGQSAGGVSTRMALCNPLMNKKFSRAVIESGGGLNEADLIKSRDEFTAFCGECLEFLGWTDEDLMTRDAFEITDELNRAARAVIKGFEVGFFQPFVDGVTIPEVTGVMVANGDYNTDIATMCGTMAGDSWMFTRKVRPDLHDNNGYFKGFAEAPGTAWAELNIEKKRAPIYTFYMDRKQPGGNRASAHFRNGPPPFGASTPHGSEIAYVFGKLAQKNPDFTEYDYRMSAAMTDYWTNFAKTGNPNGEGLTEWPLFTAETPLTMHFGEETWQAENIVTDEDERKAVEWTKAHPGMLTFVEGF